MTAPVTVSAYTLLPPDELAAVGRLAARVRATGIDPRFNLEWLAQRDGSRVADWLMYQGSELIGAATSERFGDTFEVTVAVEPQNATLAEMLVAEIEQSIIAQQNARLLVLHDHSALYLAEMLQQRGFVYDHAELMMCRSGELGSPLPGASALMIQPVGSSDLAAVASLMAEAWGGAPDDIEQYLHTQLARPANSYYLGLLNGIPIATVNMQVLQNQPWVYGLVVREAYRGCGYGRQFLMSILAEVQATHPCDVLLEVAPENTAAINLYQSLGFAGVRTFDYWAKELLHDTHS